MFQGHMHCGRQSVSNGIPYITLPGLVEATDGIAALVVSVSADGLSVTRY